MTFDLTPEQTVLVANARTLTSLPDRAIDAVLALEERAVFDGGDGAMAALNARQHAHPLLMAAAAALGIGRAAIAHAREWMLSHGVKPGPDETVPHWRFADGATEVAAARMLTYQAAQMLDRGEDAVDAISRAHAFAADAAQRAVDAAIRIVGYTRGSVVERLSTEVRSLR